LKGAVPIIEEEIMSGKLMDYIKGKHQRGGVRNGI